MSLLVFRKVIAPDMTSMTGHSPALSLPSYHSSVAFRTMAQTIPPLLNLTPPPPSTEITEGLIHAVSKLPTGCCETVVGGYEQELWRHRTPR